MKLGWHLRNNVFSVVKLTPLREVQFTVGRGHEQNPQLVKGTLEHAAPDIR